MMLYKTKGTCSSAIQIELDGDVIKTVEFIGGCSGNTQGIAQLVRGMKVMEAVERMRGIRCDFKNTSCPDQLSKALELAVSSQK